MLLWFTWLHLNDQKWSLGWSRTKPAHGLHGGARLKLRIRLPCKSHFPNMSCKICPYSKLQKYSKPALMYHRIQNSEDCALHSISSYWNKHIRMKKIYQSCQIVQSVFSQSILLEQQHLQDACACQQINVITHSCGSHLFIFGELFDVKWVDTFVGQAL